MGRLGIDAPILFSASAIVLSNDTPALVKWVARLAKVVFGSRVQICDGVDDQVEINNAIDAISSGKVQLTEGTFTCSSSIVHKPLLDLCGMGSDASILTLANNSDCDVTTVTEVGEYYQTTMRHFRINGNKANQASGHGINLATKSRPLIYDVRIYGCKEDGIHVDYGEAVTSGEIHSCVITQNDGAGIFLGFTYAYFIHDCPYIGNNAGNGITLTVGGEGSIINCCIDENFRGIFLYGIDRELIASNPYIGDNLRCGIELSATTSDIVIADNLILENGATATPYGIYICGDGQRNVIEGNKIWDNDSGDQDYGVYVDAGAVNTLIKNNDLRGNVVAAIYDAGTLTTIEDDNEGITISDIKMYRYVHNTSGGARAAGDVVRLKAVAAGNEITTTAVLGDDMVYGMVAEVINNDAWGHVQVKGKTPDVLSVSNDHGNIAIGDPLCTNDTATEACLAGAGDMAFAIAHEVCEDANCTIPAFIKSPWD